MNTIQQQSDIQRIFHTGIRATSNRPQSDLESTSPHQSDFKVIVAVVVVVIDMVDVNVLVVHVADVDVAVIW